MMSNKYKNVNDGRLSKSADLLMESCKWMAFVLTALSVPVQSVFSQDIPAAISYQGLAISNNTARTPLAAGSYPVTVRIKDSARNGNILWGRQMDVTVGDKGFFNMILTDPDREDASEVDIMAPTNSLSSVFTGFDASQRFFSFNVKGYEFTPLQQFNTTPYAVSALNAMHALGDFDVYGGLQCGIGLDSVGLLTIKTNVQIEAQIEIEKGAVLTCMKGLNAGADFISTNSAPSFAGAVVFNDSLSCAGDLQSAELRTKALKIREGALEPQSTTLFSAYEKVSSGFEDATDGQAYLDENSADSAVVEPVETDSLLLVVHSFKNHGSVKFVVKNSENNEMYEASSFTEKKNDFRHTALIPVPAGGRVEISLEQPDGKGSSLVQSVYRVRMGQGSDSGWNFDQPAPQAQTTSGVPDVLTDETEIKPLNSGIPVGDAELADPIVPDSMTCQCVLKGEGNETIRNTSVEVDVTVFADNSDDASELWHKSGVAAYANENGLITIVLNGPDNSQNDWHQAFVGDASNATGRYLGIKLVRIGDGEALQNTTLIKQRLVSAPYAFAAEQISRVADNFYVAGNLQVDGGADLGGVTASNIVVSGSVQSGTTLENRGTLQIRGSRFSVSGRATFYKGVTMKDRVTVKSNLYAEAKSTLAVADVGEGGFQADSTSLWEDDDSDEADKKYGWSCLDNTPAIHEDFSLRDSFGEGDGFFMIRARMDYMEHFWFTLKPDDGVDTISDIVMGADVNQKFSTVMTIPVPAEYDLTFNRAKKVVSCELFWLPLRRQ